MDTDSAIEAFDQLGILLNDLIHDQDNGKLSTIHAANKAVLDALVKRTPEENPWYTSENIYHKLGVIETSTRKEKLVELMSKNQPNIVNERGNPIKVAFLLKETAPVSGFNEMLVTLLAGHKFILKSTPDENLLLRFCADLLVFIHPGLSELIEFREGIFKDFDAIVTNAKSEALSNYFSKYRNHTIELCNPVGILTGEETNEELIRFGNDVFTYFGRSSENVNKILVPEGYDFTKLFEAFSGYKKVSDNFNYFKNYESHKNIMLIGKVEHLDNGFLLIADSATSIKGTGVLKYEKFSNPDHLRKIIKSLPEDSLLVESNPKSKSAGIAFGKSTMLSIDQNPYIPRLFRFLNELTPANCDA